MSEADGEYKRTVYHRGVFSPHPIQHIYERSANPRWNEEFHIRRRPVRHSPVPKKPSNKLKSTGGTDTLLQKQQSACES